MTVLLSLQSVFLYPLTTVKHLTVRITGTQTYLFVCFVFVFVFFFVLNFSCYLLGADITHGWHMWDVGVELALACRALYVWDPWRVLPAEPNLLYSYLPRGFVA